MTSLLEATETRVWETLSQKSSRSNSKKSTSSKEESQIYMPGAERATSDYGERPKDRDRSSLNLWRKQRGADKPGYKQGTYID